MMSENWRAALSAVPGNEAVGLELKEWDAARLGDVYDMDTGEFVIDLTPERMLDVVKSFEFQQARNISVPFDFAHGTLRFPGDPIKSQSYGTVGGVIFDAEAGKLRVKPGVNSKGRALIGDDSKSYSLSPVFRGPLYDPLTGEKVADTYMESCAIDTRVRQDGLNPCALSKDASAPVMLARFDSKVEVDEFAKALEQGARALLKSMGHDLDWAHIADWSGDESGTFAATFWAGEDRHLFIMDWSRADDGAVTVTNARPGEARTTYIETQQTEAAVALAKEAHMRKFDFHALAGAFAIAEVGDGVALSKGDSAEVEVPEKVAAILDAVTAKGENLTAELSKAGAELAKAEARAEQAEAEAGNAVALSKRLDAAEAELSKVAEERAAEKAAAEADAFVAALAKDGRISEGRIDKESGERVGDQRPVWRKRFVTLGKDVAAELAAEVLKPHTYKPVLLGRGIGFEAEPVRDNADARVSAVSERAKAEGISILDAARKAN